MAALDGDVLIHKYELLNDMAVALAELQAGLRDRMTPKDILEIILEAEPADPTKELICSVTVDTDEIIERIKERGWEPVKHGHWIGISDSDAAPRCSNCGRVRLGSSLGYVMKYVPYCEKCGARMDEEDEHESD